MSVTASETSSEKPEGSLSTEVTSLLSIAIGDYNGNVYTIGAHGPSSGTQLPAFTPIPGKHDNSNIVTGDNELNSDDEEEEEKNRASNPLLRLLVRTTGAVTLSQGSKRLKLVPTAAGDLHAQSVRTLATSSKWVVSGGQDESVKICRRMGLGKRLVEYGVLHRHSASLSCATFAMGDMLLITGDDSGVICFWCTKRWECIGTQLAHRGKVISITPHPFAPMLLSVGTESSSASASISVKIWDLRPRALSLVSTMDVPRVMPPYGSIPQQPLSLHFAPDGSTYTLVYNRQAILYHAVGPSAGKIASIIPSPSNSNKLTAFSYLGEGTQSTTTTTTTPSTLNSSAGSILALVGYENGDIRLVDTRSGQTLALFEQFHSSRIRSLQPAYPADIEAVLSKSFSFLPLSASSTKQPKSQPSSVPSTYSPTNHIFTSICSGGKLTLFALHVSNIPLQAVLPRRVQDTLAGHGKSEMRNQSFQDEEEEKNVDEDEDEDVMEVDSNDMPKLDDVTIESLCQVPSKPSHAQLSRLASLNTVPFLISFCPMSGPAAIEKASQSLAIPLQALCEKTEENKLRQWWSGSPYERMPEVGVLGKRSRGVGGDDDDEDSDDERARGKHGKGFDTDSDDDGDGKRARRRKRRVTDEEKVEKERARARKVERAQEQLRGLSKKQRDELGLEEHELYENAVYADEVGRDGDGHRRFGKFKRGGGGGGRGSNKNKPKKASMGSGGTYRDRSDGGSGRDGHSSSSSNNSHRGGSGGRAGRDGRGGAGGHRGSFKGGSSKGSFKGSGSGKGSFKGSFKGRR